MKDYHFYHDDTGHIILKLCSNQFQANDSVIENKFGELE